MKCLHLPSISHNDQIRLSEKLRKAKKILSLSELFNSQRDISENQMHQYMSSTVSSMIPLPLLH